MYTYLQTLADVVRIVTFQPDPRRRPTRWPDDDSFGYGMEEPSRWGREGWPRPRR